MKLIYCLLLMFLFFPRLIFAQPAEVDSLKRKLTSTNNKEQKLQSVIKIADSSKQISNLQNLSVESVEVRRSKIRKKLGLSKGDNLNSFIQNIS